MSKGTGSSAAPAARAVARLSDLHIRDFDFSEVTKPPVIVIHAPREAGMTTLITSLLVQAQKRLGVDGAVVLCDRPLPDGLYMNGVIPKDIVFSKPADKVLKALIGLQAHRLGMDGAAELPRLALALDDTLYTPKLLKSEAFQCDVKRAKNYNIMVIIATSNCDTLPKTVHTFATHVIATRCISAEEPKHLQKRMFVMFPNTDAMVETLSLCRRYEFLVGMLCPADVTSNTIVDATRVYVPTMYVGSEALARVGKHEHSWAAAGSAASTSPPSPSLSSGASHTGGSDTDVDADVDIDAEAEASSDNDFSTAGAVASHVSDEEHVRSKHGDQVGSGVVLSVQADSETSVLPRRKRRRVAGSYQRVLDPPTVASLAMNRDFVAHVSMTLNRL
jgi:hypothetical protein